MADVCNISVKQSVHEFTRNCIIEAFLQLLQTNEFHKISISEITKKAGVARISFYRNFKNKEEVLAFQIEEIFFKHIHWEEGIKNQQQLKQIFMQSFQMALEQRDFFHSLKQNNLTYLIYEQMKEKTPQHIQGIDQTKSSLFAAFFVGATFGVINHWIENDFEEPIEQIVEEFSGMVHSYYQLEMEKKNDASH